MIKTPYLMMLCFTAPILATTVQGQAAATVQAPAGVETKAPWTVPRMETYAVNLFTVNFPEPMVSDDEVGKEVRPCDGQTEGGFYRVDGPTTVTAVWTSPSSFEVREQSTPYHTLSRFIVPEGIPALSGKKMQGLTRVIGDSRSVGVDKSRSLANQEMACIFFTMEDEEHADLVREAVPHAYLAYDQKRGASLPPTTGRMPANLRPATIGDALANLEEFQYLLHEDLSDSDLERLRGQDPSTLLPDVWCIDFPVWEDTDRQVGLYLPGLGHYSAALGRHCDLKLAGFLYSRFDADLRNKRIGVGAYAVELRFSQHVPVASLQDAKALFRKQAWKAAEDRKSAYRDMEWDEARQAFTLHTDEGEIVLTLDEEATGKEIEDIKLPGGTLVRGIKNLRMKATTPAPGVRLRTVEPVTSVYGKEWKAWEGDKYDHYLSSMSTILSPDRPTLTTDMFIAGLRGEGKRLVHCETEHVTEVKARVYRIEGTGDSTPRLLQGYAELYQQANSYNRPYTGFVEPCFGDHPASKSSIGVPSILIPGRPAKAETVLIPDKNGDCSFDPAGLFPDKNAHATYFIELQADVAPESQDGKYILNQGVVQITDLGVMWKLSSGRMFAYVYRLSDGKQIPAATIHLLDETGAELGKLEATDGIAEGELPEGARYLQVVAGDDVYTTRISSRRDYMHSAAGVESQLLAWGVDPAKVVRLKYCVFKDRDLYRNGETAHIKGILRFLQGNTLSIPEIEGMTAELYIPGGTSRTMDVKVEPDGTFQLDVPIEEGCYGYGNINFKPVYKGDADGTAKDMVAAKEAGLADTSDIADDNRSFSIDLPVQDYRRNEFEVTSGMSVDAAKRCVTLTAEAHDFNTAPVAHGPVEWGISVARVNFYPEKFKDYRFGDHLEGDGGYFSAYYGNGWYSGIEEEYAGTSSALDENGKGEAVLSLPDMKHPGRCRIHSSVSVTNGNEQTLRSTRRTVLESSGVYAGLKGADKLVQAGDPIKLEALLVTPEGEAWGGAPLPATVRVRHTMFQPYRYGAKLRSAIRNEKVESDLPAREIMVGGTPAAFEIPTHAAGIYDIEIEGKDAEGRPYYTAVRKYVWGDKVSPWEYANGEGLELTANKDVYTVGDTAKILVQTPVDAELLVTVERDGVQRRFNRTVTVENPILEIPVLAEDAPYVRVSVFLVQGADRRDKSGAPVIKCSFIDLNVDMPEKRLTIDLDTPQGAITPAEECTVGGVVRDSEGKPVADAEIALYAEDEGALQAMSYTNPEPYSDFYDERLIGVATFNTLGQLLGDLAHSRYFGNKGIFVGGGGDGTTIGYCDDTTSVDRGPRRNFTPCALWLGHIKTDAEGRFSTTYTNPDTMTRYRVIAVASAGADQFGSAQSSYLVAQPVMLSASAPLTATEGDCLDVPVTVTMLPDFLPAGSPKEIAWSVSLKAENADVPAAAQTVTLNSPAPATLHFPVAVKEAGPVSLTWSVIPQTMQPGMEKYKDAVQLEFDAVPPTPHLRLPMFAVLQPGAVLKPASLLGEQLRPASKTSMLVSLSPLSGAAQGVDYLFTYPYGCSEQLSSTLLPWLMADTLSKWVDVRFPEGQSPEKVERKTVKELLNRQLGNGGFTYWGHGDQASEFTPYVCFALSYSEQAMKWGNITETAAEYLEESLKADPDSDLLALLALSRIQTEAAAPLFRAIRDKRRQWTPADRLLFACGMLECRERMDDAVQGDPAFMQLLAEAVADAQSALQAKQVAPAGFAHPTPPMDALKMLFTIKSGKAGEGLAADMRSYVMDAMSRPYLYTTWNNAWACIVIHEFCKAYASQISTEPVTVNGETVELGKPMRLDTKLQDIPDLVSAGGSPVYVSGLTEGYTVQPQKIEVVDHGFLVERRYEKLMPDNTWAPTAVFEVGDIVRVTFTATATGGKGAAYTVAEDRLPAGFEAVNPELDTQGLPEYVEKNPSSCWSASSFVDNAEIHKDRVRFFATGFGPAPRMEATYIVRVVKSGRMTAPAAKVERMYRPDVYGLSIPQEFTVKPRKD